MRPPRRCVRRAFNGNRLVVFGSAAWGAGAESARQLRGAHPLDQSRAFRPLPRGRRDRGRRRRSARPVAGAARRRRRRLGRRRVRIRWVVRCVGACWVGPGGAGPVRAGRNGGTNTEDQARAPPRIADRDRLTVADVDRRHPGAVDEDAVGAPLDGHPVGAGEPQHKNRARGLRWRSGVARAIQRDVAAGCRSPRSRRGRGERRTCIGPTHTVNGEAEKAPVIGGPRSACSTCSTR